MFLIKFTNLSTVCFGVLGPLNLSFSKMALFNEDPCVKEGGQCLEEGLCPEGKLASRGLCPEQQKRGVECCNGGE